MLESLNLGRAVPRLRCLLWGCAALFGGTLGGSVGRAARRSAGAACCVILVPVGVRVAAAAVGCAPRC